jgi:chemotaxis family two-component system response regulator Rcp1
MKQPFDMLLVEDNPGDADLTRERLEFCKVRSQIHLVPNGIEALRFLRREGEYAHAPRPDLILLDLNLPKKDGRETLEEIKRDRSFRRIPVIIFTSSEAAKDIAISYDLGANAYIVKPVDLERFTEIVRAIEHFWFEVVRLPAA